MRYLGSREKLHADNFMPEVDEKANMIV